MSQNPRAEILGKVRRALASAAAPASENGAEPSLAESQTTASNDFGSEDLCGLLRRELDSLGARSYLIGTWQEAARTTLLVLGEKKTGLVSLGPGKAVQSLRALVATQDPADGASRYLESDAAPQVAASADAGIVEAELAIAATGSIVLDTGSGLLSSLLPPALIALVPRQKIVPDLTSAMAQLAGAGIAGGRITLVTGPSRTADIEKKLVLGVHGPEHLTVLLLEGEASGA